MARGRRRLAGRTNQRINIDRLIENKPRESDIEKNWGVRAKAHGWIFRKYKSEQHNSVPDRLLLRSGQVVFIEFKAPGEPATELQLDEHRVLRAAGFKVYVIDFYDKEFADLCLK